MIDTTVYIRNAPIFCRVALTTYDSSDMTDLGVGLGLNTGYPPFWRDNWHMGHFFFSLQKNLTPFSSSLPNIWALPRFTRMFNDFSMTSGSMSWNSVEIVVSSLV
jgi:hypothetical protein